MWKKNYIPKRFICSLQFCINFLSTHPVYFPWLSHVYLLLWKLINEKYFSDKKKFGLVFRKIYIFLILGRIHFSEVIKIFSFIYWLYQIWQLIFLLLYILFRIFFFLQFWLLELDLIWFLYQLWSSFFLLLFILFKIIFFNFIIFQLFYSSYLILIPLMVFFYLR